ncbi:type II secretion system protein GspG [Desulfosporosinus sp. PR]|uniref:type II secretion system protein GspG n=1 Tax=Candidatus Desulfosporosinus nitrosoreducens TaxID=3401928 RepID=UPI0027FBE53A|nr:type II secretion system protein GspG [Desulfosporosinus sp. PR]MDQ7095762.1 type II secretion system protein GspG [Desulfosporosinus sp. PR]
MQKNEQSGYSLWELALVLFLMGVLLCLVVPHFSSSAYFVRNQVDMANKQRIEGAAQIYRLDVGRYPVRVSDLVSLPVGVSGWRGPYLKEIPVSPFNSGQDYQIDAYGQVK